jgi:cytochrome c2
VESRRSTAGLAGINGRASVVVLAACVVALFLALLLAGCGSSGPSSGSGSGSGSSSSSVPAYVTAPFTHEERLVEQGARLAVADGCTACHLVGKSKSVGPDFAGLAGHAVTLADGRRVLVDERFLREGLEHPERAELKGYGAAPMLAAVKRLHLAAEPDQVAALAAFIEQIGPEEG